MDRALEQNDTTFRAALRRMTRKEREEAILSVVRQLVDELGVDPTKIEPDTLLSDLGIDSLHAVDLVFRFEEKFEINISMEDFHATTVAEAVDFMDNLLDDAAGAIEHG